MLLEDFVEKFHVAFGHPVRSEPQVIPSEREAWLAFQLILEELQELADSWFDGSVSLSVDTDEDGLKYNPDLVLSADAIADLRVVVTGAGLRMGLPLSSLDREVFDSNMSKLSAEGDPIYSRGVELDGKPEGKILKGENFREPDIAGVLASC